MQNKKRAFIIIIIAAALFTASIFIFDFQDSGEPQPSSKEESLNQAQNESTALSINFGDKKETFKAEPGEDTTVYDFLKKAAEEKDITLKTKEHEFGIIIIQIGEKENTKSDKNWLFYVNGEMAKEAVNKINLEEGDKVEFKYEQNPFWFRKTKSVIRLPAGRQVNRNW